MIIQDHLKSFRKALCFSSIHVLAFGQSDKDFHKFKSAQSIIIVLIHILFFKICRFKVSINNSCIQFFIQYSCLCAENVEFSFLYVRWVSIVSNYLQKNFFKCLKVIPNDFSNLYPFFFVTCNPI